MDKVPVTIRINEAIWKEARKYAIDKDLSIGALVETALIHEIQRK